MNRYLLFACASYYPEGGWHDFQSSHETLEDAVIAAANTRCDHWHVVDITTGTVERYGRKGE